MSIFSERLASLRKTQNVTQKSLAEYLGVNTRTVQFYEAGDKRPELEGIMKIAKFFNVSIDYLAGQSDELRGTSVSLQEAEFLRWVDENVSDVFFHDFDASPEESKRQLMADLRYMWERGKKNRK